MNNAFWNAKNPWQGDRKKVLCVCSAGLLRSPTTAFVLSQEPYGFNTRAAGVDTDWALIPVTSVLLHWADEIVCMNDTQAAKLQAMMNDVEFIVDKPIKVLNISDDHGFRDAKLIEIIKERYDEASK